MNQGQGQAPTVPPSKAKQGQGQAPTVPPSKAKQGQGQAPTVPPSKAKQGQGQAPTVPPSKAKHSHVGHWRVSWTLWLGMQNSGAIRGCLAVEGKPT